MQYKTNVNYYYNTHPQPTPPRTAPATHHRRRLHTLPGRTRWTSTFTPFGVLLAPAETWKGLTYGLLALQEAAKRVLGINITFAGQNTDAHSSALKVAEVFEMQISTLCFPHVIRRVLLTPDLTELT
jgi:hypothetical protein